MSTQMSLTPTPTQSGVLDAIYHRRAVRSYLPDAVDDVTIRRLLDAAVRAPTAIHEEPWEFVIVQDRGVMQRISDRAKSIAIAEASAHRELLRAPGAASGGRFLARLADPNFNIFYDAGTLVVICGRGGGPFVAADCWLAAENLMIAATGLDLGTCCIGFALPALHAPDVKRELGIPEDVEPVVAIIVGVPNGETPPVGRKPPQILRWIRPTAG